MDTRDDSGQASIEHLGLMALVALVLLAAGAISTVAAPGVVNRVTTAMQRSLCVVTGSSCPTLAREPCPVRRTDRTRTTRASIGFLRLGDDRALTIERRSDGSYMIELVEGIGAGAGVTFGRTGLDASADAVLSARSGRTWRASSAADARAMVERLRKRALPAVDHVISGAADLAGLREVDPTLDSYTLSGTAAGEATAELGLGDLVGAGARGEATAEIGVRIAAHRREATAYIALDGRVNAFFDALPSVSLPRSGRAASARGGRSADATNDPLAKVLNPAPLEQQAEAFTRGIVALRLAPGPRILEAEVTGTVGIGDDARELHARLDPAEPDVAAALAALRRTPGDPRRLADLGAASAASAALDERRYAVTADEHEIGAELGIGPSPGLRSTDGTKTMTLTEQRSRPIGGIWERRLDCEIT